MNRLEYKGYFGSFELSNEDNLFFGKIEHIRSLVTYEGASAQELKASFQEAVDDYLDTCSQRGIEPEKPFKGSLNVRLGEKLHRKIAILANKENKKINTFIKDALETVIKENVS